MKATKRRATASGAAAAAGELGAARDRESPSKVAERSRKEHEGQGRERSDVGERFGGHGGGQ